MTKLIQIFEEKLIQKNVFNPFKYQLKTSFNICDKNYYNFM